MKAMSSMGARMTHGASSIWSRLRPGCPRKTACMKRARYASVITLPMSEISARSGSPSAMSA